MRGQGYPNPGDRPQVRRHDYGFSAGGPVILPKVYDGHEKTFFFANFEKYRNRENKFNGLGTLPTDAMRNGDFSALLTSRVLGTDPLGRPILENQIYDPATERIVNGQLFAIRSRTISFRRTGLTLSRRTFKTLFRRPQVRSQVLNYERRYTFRKIQAIPEL